MISFKRISALLLITIVPLILIFGIELLLRNPVVPRRLIAFFKGVEYLGREGVIFQRHGHACGEACVAMILKYNGVPIRDEDSSWQLDSGSEMNMLQIKSILESQGLGAEGWKLSFDDLYRINLPAIALVDKNHFVILSSMGLPDGVIVLDPGIGRVRYSRRAFCKAWTGDILIANGVGAGSGGNGGNDRKHIQELGPS